MKYQKKKNLQNYGATCRWVDSILLEFKEMGIESTELA